MGGAIIGGAIVGGGNYRRSKCRIYGASVAGAIILSAEQLSAEQMSAEQMSPDQLSAEQLSAEQMSPEQMSAEQMSPEQMSRSICRGAFVAFFGAIVGGAFVMEPTETHIFLSRGEPSSQRPIEMAGNHEADATTQPCVGVKGIGQGRPIMLGRVNNSGGSRRARCKKCQSEVMSEVIMSEVYRLSEVKMSEVYIDCQR